MASVPRRAYVFQSYTHWFPTTTTQITEPSSLCHCRCAQAELREEGQLKGGELIRLVATTIPETKWCLNSFAPYLCIDPERMC